MTSWWKKSVEDTDLMANFTNVISASIIPDFRNLFGQLDEDVETGYSCSGSSKTRHYCECGSEGRAAHGERSFMPAEVLEVYKKQDAEVVILRDIQ